MTPLIEREAHGRRVLLKMDTRFASGSYKDRGAAVVVSHCKRIGITHIVEDSSGNAGAAFAMYAAAAGISCDIYVPESASPGKLIQVEVSGARLVRVPGTRADTSAAVWEAAQGAYYASHSWNPFFFHGTKTFAFEVCEQLGWKAPGAVVVPTGNGTLLLGCAIGFEELRRAGVIARVPRLIAVQSRACMPLVVAMEKGAAKCEPFDARQTVAEGIAIANPVRGAQCLEAMRSSDGRAIAVGEDEVVSALRWAVSRGLFIEPTCASALAAAAQLRDDDMEDGPVVLAITGHGLKSAERVRQLVG
jgi:threonine synthase